MPKLHTENMHEVIIVLLNEQVTTLGHRHCKSVYIHHFPVVLGGQD